MPNQRRRFHHKPITSEIKAIGIKNRLVRIIPWEELSQSLEPYYPNPQGAGRRPIGLEHMLRIYFMQHWYNLSDPAMEEALYDSRAMREFARIDLGNEPAPDETTILNFRIANPAVAGLALVTVFGVYALMDGVVAIAGGVQRKHLWGLVHGGIAILAGVAAFVRPVMTALALTTLVGVFAIVSGVVQVAVAWKIRHEIEGEGWLILGGVAAVVFGGLVLANPFEGAGAILLVNQTASALDPSRSIRPLGAGRRLALRGTGGGPRRVTLAVPSWAGTLQLDVRFPSAVWPRITEVGLAVWDTAGFLIAEAPLNYATTRQRVALAPAEARPVEIEVMPAFALPGDTTPWTAELTAVFLPGGMPAASTTMATTVGPADSISVPGTLEGLEWLAEDLQLYVEASAATSGAPAAVRRALVRPAGIP